MCWPRKTHGYIGRWTLQMRERGGRAWVSSHAFEYLSIYGASVSFIIRNDDRKRFHDGNCRNFEKFVTILLLSRRERMVGKGSRYECRAGFERNLQDETGFTFEIVIWILRGEEKLFGVQPIRFINSINTSDKWWRSLLRKFEGDRATNKSCHSC